MELSREIIDALVDHGDLGVQTALALGGCSKYCRTAVRAKIDDVIHADSSRFHIFGIMRLLGLYMPRGREIEASQRFLRDLRTDAAFVTRSFFTLIGRKELYEHPEWHEWFIRKFAGELVALWNSDVFAIDFRRTIAIMLQRIDEYERDGKTELEKSAIYLLLQWLTVKIRDMYRVPWLLEQFYDRCGGSCPVLVIHKRLQRYERDILRWDLIEDAEKLRVAREAKKMIAMLMCSFAYGTKSWFAMHEGENGSVYMVQKGGRKRYITHIIEELM